MYIYLNKIFNKSVLSPLKHLLLNVTSVYSYISLLRLTSILYALQ